MPPKRTIASFITAASEPGCQHIENETAANEGEVGERRDKNFGGGANKNGMSNFIFSPPPHILCRSAAANNKYKRSLVNVQKESSNNFKSPMIKTQRESRNVGF